MCADHVSENALFLLSPSTSTSSENFLWHGKKASFHLKPLKQKKIRKRRLFGHFKRSRPIWPYLTSPLIWHDVGGSKLYKAMTSLNAFDIRNQRYAKPWCLWTPLTRVKTGIKVIDMFDLAFDRDQMHGKPIRYLIPALTCVKGGVKVKIKFDLFFV